MVRDIYAAWIMYIYIYKYIYIWILSTKENHQLSPSEFETWVHVMATWDVCFRVFFCFHSWFRTCVPCLYLDHLGPRAAYLRRLDPPPHEYPVRELCFWLIFSKRKNSFGLHLDVGGAQGTLSTPYLVTCHFSVGGAQGTLSTPYLVTCHFSVGGAQSTLSTPYLVTWHFSVGWAQGTLSTPYLVKCHFSVGGAPGTLSTPYLVTCHFSVGGAQSTIFSVGGAQGTLSTPYLVTCHFSVGGAQSTLSTPYLVTCHFPVGRTQGILSTPLLDFISNFQKPPMWSSYWLWSLEQPRLTGYTISTWSEACVLSFAWLGNRSMSLGMVRDDLPTKNGDVFSSQMVKFPEVQRHWWFHPRYMPMIYHFYPLSVSHMIFSIDHLSLYSYVYIYIYICIYDMCLKIV